MYPTTLIQAELDRIETDAEQRVAQFLAVQDTYIAAYELVERLKAHGASDDLRVTVCYHLSSRAAAVLTYPTANDDDAATLAALALEADSYTVSRGYNDETTRITLDAAPDIEIYVRASALDWRAAA